ncbi:10871_t:CDS:2, partial [Ambispora leptoticha]
WEVNTCYHALFEQNEDGVFWVSVIARTAFSTIAIPTIMSEYCAFTLAVCDILLNPCSQNILCKESRMRYRINQYLSNFKSSSSPSHESANNILNNENRRNEPSREASPQHTKAESESPAPRSSFMSQEEMDELFELDL